MIINESLMDEEHHLTEMIIEGKQVRIYDNCVPSDDFKKIRNILLGDVIDWHYYSGPEFSSAETHSGTNDNTGCAEFRNVERTKSKLPIDGLDIGERTYEFIHKFYMHGWFDWSPFTTHLGSILNILNPRAWIKIVAHLDHKESKHLMSARRYADNINKAPYTDAITSYLCMNTNNGYILMETGDKIEIIENRLVVFPCDILHTNISQTNTNVKVLLDFNFLPHH